MVSRTQMGKKKWPERGEGTAPPKKQEGRREQEKHGSEAVMFVDCLRNVESFLLMLPFSCELQAHCFPIAAVTNDQKRIN